MKRESKLDYPRVDKLRTVLFWKKCRFCRFEFRRECGYKIIDLIPNDKEKVTYCCSSCCNNEQEVKQKILLEKREFFRKKPGFRKASSKFLVDAKLGEKLE